MRRVYKTLLKLYPPEHKATFAEEMLTVFEEAAEERRRQGWVVFVCFLIAELTDLIIGIGAEWTAKLSGSGYRFSPSLSSAAAYRMVQKMRPAWVSQEVFFKAVDLIDETRAARCQTAVPREVIEAERRVEFLLNCIVETISSQEFQKARFYSDLESKEREKLHLLRRKYRIK
ncbi:MAG TPA: hypothetical protein VID27_22265 [Blastocatellia bacterium]